MRQQASNGRSWSLHYAKFIETRSFQNYQEILPAIILPATVSFRQLFVISLPSVVHQNEIRQKPCLDTWNPLSRTRLKFFRQKAEKLFSNFKNDIKISVWKKVCPLNCYFWHVKCNFDKLIGRFSRKSPRIFSSVAKNDENKRFCLRRYVSQNSFLTRGIQVWQLRRSNWAKWP